MRNYIANRMKDFIKMVRTLIAVKFQNIRYNELWVSIMITFSQFNCKNTLTQIFDLLSNCRQNLVHLFNEDAWSRYFNLFEWFD